MQLLATGLLLFFGVHSIAMVSHSARDAAIARWGVVPWRIFYAALSAIGLALVARGYAAARTDPVLLYETPIWLRHVTGGLMAFVFPLVLAAYLPGRIQRALKHPMLVAAMVWAFAHLLSNGTLADLLLFGGFLTWAFMNLRSMRTRPARPLLVSAPPRWRNDTIAVVGGFVLYFVMMRWLHVLLIGIPPMVMTGT